MRILNRNLLKYIAVVAMIIDHVASFLMKGIWGTPIYMAFRFIGRLTAPIMFYFLVEGFIHTSSKSKYFIRLLIFTFISQGAYDFAHNRTVLNMQFSVIYTLLCCFLMLWSFEYFENIPLKILSVLFFGFAARFGDWGTSAPIWVMGFYLFNKHDYLKLLPFFLLSLYKIIIPLCEQSYKSALMTSGLLAFIPIILLYNKKAGSKHPFNKWFFYIMYPLHLVIIMIIKCREID